MSRRPTPGSWRPPVALSSFPRPNSRLSASWTSSRASWRTARSWPPWARGRAPWPPRMRPCASPGSYARSPPPEVEGERAALAARPRPAMRLGHGDQKGVELVEKGRIGRQVPFQEVPERLVVAPVRHDAVPQQYPPRVGIRHEDGPPGRVEQDGVGRLGADPGHGQEIAAQWRERGPTEPLRTAARPFQEKPREGEQASRLEPPGARGSDEPAERRRGQPGQPARLEAASRVEIADGASGAGPGGMLGEHGAHGHLERAPCRPPALRAIARVQGRVEPEQSLLHRRIARTSEAS